MRKESKLGNFLFFLIFVSLVSNLTIFTNALIDCKFSGCAENERCMADGFCTPLSVKEYCESKGFPYAEIILTINCSKELPKEREFLCKQCKGDYEYSKRINSIIDIIFNVAAGIAVLLLVVNGFRLFTAEDTFARENAKKAILYVLLGLIILILARAIISAILLPPLSLPRETTTTTTQQVTTTLPPVSICIGFSTCTDCLANNCKWCHNPQLAPSICLEDCNDCNAILGTCLQHTCEVTTTTSTTITFITTITGITSTTTTSTTTTTTINIPCESLVPPNCNGICPSGEACIAEGSICKCTLATTTTTTSTTTTTTIRAKLTVMFVPVNWVGDLSTFDSAVQAQANKILENIPLKDCPSAFVVKKATSNCNIGYINCICSELFRIASCAQATGETYDYVVGLHNGDVCDNALGFSCYVGTVFSETRVALVAAHELGHEWGLNDEYCSQLCAGCPAGPPNALSKEEFCDPTPGRDCCSACVGYNVHCYGNVQKDCIDSSGSKICDGRAIMSYGSAPGPRGQDRPSWNHLLTIPKLRCN